MERRKFLRLPHRYVLRHGRYTASDFEYLEGTTINIGGGGLLFVSKEPYAIYDLLKLEINIPGWEKFIPASPHKETVEKTGSFLAKAIVTRIDKLPAGTHEVAAAFVDLDRQKLWALMFAINKK